MNLSGLGLTRHHEPRDLRCARAYKQRRTYLHRRSRRINIIDEEHTPPADLRIISHAKRIGKIRLPLAFRQLPLCLGITYTHQYLGTPFKPLLPRPRFEQHLRLIEPAYPSPVLADRHRYDAVTVSHET